MEDTIIIYTSSEHLNSALVLAEFINKHHPSLFITLISTLPHLLSVTSIHSITYHCLPSPTGDIPSNLTTRTNPVDIHFEIACLYNPILKQFLLNMSLQKNIKAFVIDFFCNPAFEVSTSLNIPTYFYDCTGGFGACVFLYFPTMDQTIIPQQIGDVNDFLDFPGCPPLHSLDIPKGMHFRNTNSYQHFLHTARNMRKSKGILVNSFDALEPRAKDALLNGLCVPNAKTPPVFFVAPLVANKKIRNEHECLTWLNSQPSKSVVFLCFGRRGLFSKQQLREMATGLENCDYRFLWSVRNPPGQGQAGCVSEEPDLDALLPAGFIERNKEKGFIIKTWAPQEEILSHDSIGGFVTHCGRSSVLEAVSFGVPMISFPIYADQRMHKVFMVEEMKVSLPLEEEAGGMVLAGELEKRVRELMGSSKNGKAIRQHVVELKASAEAAVRKCGSSVGDLEKFVKLVFS